MLKCDKCGYVSFDYNDTCPVCNKDLSVVRTRLGIHYERPQTDFDDLFTGQSGAYAAAAKAKPRQETELDLESVSDEFEFTLDD
jgi:uncharacterized Zn finger protein (UPF0148 family)